MPSKESVSRLGDMHPNRGIALHQQSDGDVIISIFQDGMTVEGHCGDERASVEFCTSGGRSQRTRKALVALIEAIKLDNSEHPLG